MVQSGDPFDSEIHYTTFCRQKRLTEFLCHEKLDH